MVSKYDYYPSSALWRGVCSLNMCRRAHTQGAGLGPLTYKDAIQDDKTDHYCHCDECFLNPPCILVKWSRRTRDCYRNPNHLPGTSISDAPKRFKFLKIQVPLGAAGAEDKGVRQGPPGVHRALGHPEPSAPTPGSHRARPRTPRRARAPPSRPGRALLRPLAPAPSRGRPSCPGAPGRHALTPGSAGPCPTRRPRCPARPSPSPPRPEPPRRELRPGATSRAARPHGAPPAPTAPRPPSGPARGRGAPAAARAHAPMRGRSTAPGAVAAVHGPVRFIVGGSASVRALRKELKRGSCCAVIKHSYTASGKREASLSLALFSLSPLFFPFF